MGVLMVQSRCRSARHKVADIVIANLPLKQRLKLLRQDLFAKLSYRGNKHVRIYEHPLGARIDVDDNEIVVPSPLRWKLYRKGWPARLNQLEQEYGVGTHIQLTNNSVILDIGANAGEFAHIAARYGAHIHCIEPDAAVFACLQDNIQELVNVTAYRELIWKEECNLEFYSAPAQADSSVFEGSSEPAETMRATTVETFCHQHNISNIDLLKYDAEGAEPEVLEGIGAMFPKISVIALDTGRERHGERTNEACTAILKKNGFHVTDETVGKRLMTFGVRA